MRAYAILLLLVCNMTFLDSQVAIARTFPSRCAHNFNQAMALKRSGDLATSVRYFQEAIKICPDPLFYRQLGHAYEDLKRWKEAERAYTSAINMDPSDGELHLFRGILYYSVKAYDHSFQDLKVALTRSLRKEAEHRVLYYLGLVHLEKHQLRQATTAIEQAIDVCGNCRDRSGYMAQLRVTRNELKKEQAQKLSVFETPQPRSEATAQLPPRQSRERHAAAVEQHAKELQRQQEEASRLLRKQREDQIQAQQHLEDIKRQTEEMAILLEKQQQAQSKAEQQARELKFQQEVIRRKIERQKEAQQAQEQQTTMQAQSNYQESSKPKQVQVDKLDEVPQLPTRATATTSDAHEFQRESDAIAGLTAQGYLTLKDFLREYLYHVRFLFVRYRSHLAYVLLLGFAITLVLLLRLIYAVSSHRLH